MKARKFIEEYLSSCDDNIVCLHSPSGYSATTFTIHEWHEWKHKPMESENVYDHLDCEVSQIRAEVENYHYNLAVVIHIYTDRGYEEGE